MRLKHSRLTHFQTGKLLEHFVAGVTARTVADLAGVNRNTARQFYQRLREIIAWQIEEEWQFSGEIEVDESYFGGARKGRRGRGAAGKVAVFGILQRGGKVYTKVIEDAKTTTLLPIIRQRVVPDSIVYTDYWRSYNALDISEFKHCRINHSKLFAHKHNHINGIENFWNQAKRHLRKYNGIPRQHFQLFLKECEWRFNYGSPKQLLDVLKSWVTLYNQT